MPKHIAREFHTARLVLSLAATILVILVGWVAVRAGGPAAADQPVIVQPSAPGGDLQALEGPLPPVTEAAPAPDLLPSASPSASLSLSPSPSLSPSGSASRSASRKPKKSSSPKPSTTPPAPSASPSAGGLQVTYSAGASRRDSFIAGLRIVNNGPVARDFTITITYPSGTDLRIRGDWNATAGASGNRVTVRGGSLAPGASITAGFQAVKGDNDSGRATGCTVVGGTCIVS